MRYTTEVYVHSSPVRELLEKYRNAKAAQEACRVCQNYGRVWSCPPDMPDADNYLEAYQEIFVIAVKVNYPQDLQTRVKSFEAADQVRKDSYEKVKGRMLLTLSTMETAIGGGKALGAGRCILCERCAREAGRPCCQPQKRRYSVTGFGFDFTKILADFFQIPLLWVPDGLPAYDVAVAMFAR